MGKDLSKCSVGFHYGRNMHTYCGTSAIDEWKYIDCDELSIEPNTYYKVWLTKTYPADPCDQSSTTVVYHFEKVPDIILEMQHKVEAYFQDKQPIE